MFLKKFFIAVFNLSQRFYTQYGYCNNSLFLKKFIAKKVLLLRKFDFERILLNI